MYHPSIKNAMINRFSTLIVELVVPDLDLCQLPYLIARKHAETKAFSAKENQSKQRKIRRTDALK